MEEPSKQFYYKRNRLQQIKGFCYTVQAGSMAKSAERMGLTPSTITLQIQSLERDLGIKLFERDLKKIKLTHEGQMFYNYSVSYVQGIENLFENFAQIAKNKKSNVISVGGNVSICYILPKYIQQFEYNNPEVKFEIRNLVKQDAIKRLINDEIDILVYSMTPKLLPSELDFFPIVEYPPILLTNKNHTLNKKEKITLTDIKEHKLLRLDPQFITVPNFDEVVKCHGLETKIEFEMANYEILKKFVKAGVGIAIVSSICLEDESDQELVGRNLSDHFPSLTYGIMVKKNKISHPLLQKFIDHLQDSKLLSAQKNA
jgi:LysR family cys regulon transcriptional activator